MTVADSPMARLRQGTRDLHQALDSLPYFQALKDGTAALESYLSHLRALAIIHGALEHELRPIAHPAVARVWRDSMARLQELLRDLDFFEGRLIPDVPEAAEGALEVADRIRLQGARDPVALLGFLYVLEGSTLGARQVGPVVVATFGLGAGGGAGYLSGRSAGSAESWGGFRARMDAALAAPADEVRALDGARELFGQLGRIFRALHPLDPARLARSLAAINPEAGRHPIPSDPIELRAALAAADEALRRMPYFELRFGERGRRFARSDSAWLATLAACAQPVIDGQVAWLAGVLAARGMPSWTLQVHLELLHQQLCAAAPERAGAYAGLLQAARRLAERRNAIVSDEAVARLSAAVDGALTSADAPLREAAWLVASAVADEQAGLQNAVGSLIPWLTDRGRFGPDFADAVHRALREVQGLARAGAGPAV